MRIVVFVLYFITIAQIHSSPPINKPDQLLVIGCGRSGTNYLAKFLELSGYEIYHERPGNTGCVSWPMTVHSYSPWGPTTEKTFKHLFHEVRHPLDVMSSWAINLSDLTRDEWVFIRRHLPEIEITDSLLVHCAKYWYYWNLLAEKRAEWRFQIEEFPKLLHEFSIRSELTLNSDVLKTLPTNFNSWAQIDRKLTWHELHEQLPEELYQNIKDMAIRYGYTN